MSDQKDNAKLWSEQHEAQRVYRRLLAELEEQRAINEELREALWAAVDCGMVPSSSAKDGGAVRYSKQVKVADQIRAALEVKGE